MPATARAFYFSQQPTAPVPGAHWPLKPRPKCHPTRAGKRGTDRVPHALAVFRSISLPLSCLSKSGGVARGAFSLVLSVALCTSTVRCLAFTYMSLVGEPLRTLPLLTCRSLGCRPQQLQQRGRFRFYSNARKRFRLRPSCDARPHVSTSK